MFITGNPIKKLRLDNLPALNSFDGNEFDGSLYFTIRIAGYPLEFVQINNMPNIELLALADNEITSVKLNNNPNTRGVTLEENNIQAINLLEGFENIEALDLSSNPILDLAPLASFTTLKYLGLRNIGSMGNYDGRYQADPIDLTPLYGLQNLSEIDLRDNQLYCDTIYNLQVALPATYIRSGPGWSWRPCICLCANGGPKEYYGGYIMPCSQICPYQ